MYGPFLAIARKKRCSRRIFRLGAAAWRARARRRRAAVREAPADDAHDFARRRRPTLTSLRGARGRRARLAPTENALAAVVKAAPTSLFSCVGARTRYSEKGFLHRRSRRTLGGENNNVGEERMTKRVTMAAATAGHAEGRTTLNAFDNALLVAGIGNINLIKVSSILPPEVPVIELPKIKPGALVPTAYAAMTSETPGETVAAAVGYAVPDDPAKNGVIMEFHGIASRAEAERQISAMLDEAFQVRGEIMKEKRIFAVEHTVERIGCALAAITLLADEDLV